MHTKAYFYDPEDTDWTTFSMEDLSKTLDRVYQEWNYNKEHKIIEEVVIEKKACHK